MTPTTDKGGATDSVRSPGINTPSRSEHGCAASPEGAEWIDPFEMTGAGHPECSNPDCGYYPQYGVAPHECYYKKGPGHTIGQSTLLPREKWPASFVLDLEPGEDPETVTYPGACGVYYCPTCVAEGRS